MSSLSNLTIHSIGGGWGKDVEDEGLELVAVIRGTDIPNLEINNIQGVPFRYETQKKIQSRLLQIGDLVIEISGGSASSKQRTGRCLYITDELLKNLGGKVIPASFCKLLRLDRKKVNSKYVYYQIKAMHLSDEIASFENQSTGISNFQFNRFIDEIRPSILDIEVQNKIVNFLEKIDLKIINNININQTLEQIAQTIFKSWFIDFDPVHAKANALASGQTLEQATQAAMAVISGKNTQELHRLQTANPEQYQQLWEIAEAFPSGVDEEGVPRGWESKSLDEIAIYQNGLALQKFRPESEDEYLPVVKIAQLKQGYADGKEKASVNIKPECIIDNGDVIFSWSGSLVVDIWCGGKAALNQHLFKVTSKNYPKWLYYFYTVHHLAEFQRIAADKAVTMGHIKREHLSLALCVIPNNEFIQKFCFLEDYISQIVNNRLQNVSLIKIRDELLPKLLSGEI
ncbi:restriction endonuclease subunit S [Glaesserella parasuis]|nr:restriction endonuclease subunit S [Glaesserella parasuis]MDP0045741.1 restriction endonuclease subunit S [Glaesserella parasuis]MDP0137211.1 restriction endonuclease subunit S [Glaesserella parasuis]